MTGRNHLVVFTDLDGTLLDHETYSFEPALPALQRLGDGGHAVILASSKTAAEIEPLRRSVGFAHCPAVVENGAGILPPEDPETTPTDAGRAVHQKLLDVLNALPSDLRAGFAGFSDWSVDDVSARTGLSPEAARAAKVRAHSEPGEWSGNNEDFVRFCDALRQSGVSVQKGGRFTTLSFGGTKGDRVREIIEQEKHAHKQLISLALGDAPNDVDMLKAVDIGIVIPNPAHRGIADLLADASGTIRYAQLPGPDGWNAEMLKILDE